MLEAFQSWNIADIQQCPANHHWTQSPLETVVRAEVLLGRGDALLVRTDFTAPRLTERSPFTTADVGETYAAIGTPKLYRCTCRLFYSQIFETCYTKGVFPHLDFTLWYEGKRSKAFANLRQYPEGSYYSDEITAHIRSDDLQRGAGTHSRIPIAEDDEPPPPVEQRSIPLEGLIQAYRGNHHVALTTGTDEYEGEYDDKNPLVLSDKTGNCLFPSEVDEDQCIDANSGKVRLERLLQIFSSLLNEAGVSYR